LNLILFSRTESPANYYKIIDYRQPAVFYNNTRLDWVTHRIFADISDILFILYGHVRFFTAKKW